MPESATQLPRDRGAKRAISGQRGIAMIALITLLTLISAYYIARGLNRTSNEVTQERHRRSNDALLEAKAALIAWAAAGAYQDSSVSFQPGGFPCPDTDDDGDAEGTCATASTRIGRLPWTTIGAGDLRDASGARLWYALSDNFRKKACTTVSPKSPSDCTIINFDTAGTLTITGSSSASNVIAIVFAPGQALSTQDRDPSNSVKWNSVSNFLDGANAGTNDDIFEMRSPPNDVDSTGSVVFNDRLVAITASDLWPAVEGVVAAKLQENDGIGGLAIYIEQYRTTWSRYPFAASFDPGASTFKGAAGTTEGLLPMTTDSTFLTWKTAGPAPTIAAAPGNPGTVDVSQAYTNCTSTTPTQVNCKANYCGTTPNQARVRITATANNSGMAFVRAFVASDLNTQRSTFGMNINFSSTTAVILASTYTLAADGTGVITLDLRMPSRSCSENRTIWARIPVPPYHALTTPTDTYTGWFSANQWYKHVYYAVAPAYAPGGATCTAGGSPACLTVNNITGQTDNKLALLLFAGRPLPGTTRPSTTLNNYFEGQNASASDLVFDYQPAAGSSFNDRVLVLSP